jgi:glutathione S-transferase
MMKLRFSTTSPFVRKVVIRAIETGLDSRIERIPTNTNDPASGLAKENPLGKVPSLTLDNGTILFDSPVICEYLDGLHTGAKMVPSSGEARWTALRRQALADGIMDAAILRRLEARRLVAEQSTAWMEIQRAKVAAGLDALEREADSLGDGIDIGRVAIACALGYLDFRFAHEEWRQGRLKLSRWFEGFAKRPSVQATTPKDA